MRERGFHTVNPLDDCTFQSSGALLLYSAKGHTDEFFRTTFSNLPENGKGCRMAFPCGKGMEKDPPNPKECCNKTFSKVEGEVPIAAHQAIYYFYNDKIRGKGKGHPDDGEKYAFYIFPLVRARLRQGPKNRRRGFFLMRTVLSKTLMVLFFLHDIAFLSNKLV